MANKKLKLLYLARYLREQTDEQHPKTMQDMIAYLAGCGISAERKSLYDDLELLRVYGMDVQAVKGKSYGYFLGERDFQLPELKLLIDVVQASPFLTQSKSMALIGKLEQLTHDHTLVADLLEQGKITEEEAFVHPQRHILLQALGVEETVQADFFSFSLQECDRLLLCSDGLSDMLRAAEIRQLIGCSDLKQAADKLLEQSLDNGGRDNVSLILIDLTTQGEESCNG